MAADPFDLVSKTDFAALREALRLDPNLAAGCNDAGTSLLAWAAYHRSGEATAIVRLALLEIDPYEACIIGDSERLKAALADGWDANAPAPDGFSALGLAAFFAQEAIADLLLPVTRDVNQPAANAQRVAALHAATAMRQHSIASKLLRAGADPDLPQAGGILPLHVAAHQGDAAFCGLLTLFGADPHLADGQGRSASAYARAGGHDWLAERLQRL